MTDFIGVEALARWVAARGPQNVIHEMTDRMEADFAR